MHALLTLCNWNPSRPDVLLLLKHAPPCTAHAGGALLAGSMLVAVLAYCGCRAAAITSYKRYIDARHVDVVCFSGYQEELQALHAGYSAYAQALHSLRGELRAVLERLDRGCSGAAEERTALHGRVQRFHACLAALLAAAAVVAAEMEQKDAGTCCMLCVTILHHLQHQCLGYLTTHC